MSYLFNWRSKRAVEMKIAHFPHLSMFSGGTGKWDAGTSEGRATLFTLTPSRPTRNRINPRDLLNSNQTHSYLNISYFSSGDWKKFCKIVRLNLILHSLSPHKTTHMNTWRRLSACPCPYSRSLAWISCVECELFRFMVCNMNFTDRWNWIWKCICMQTADHSCVSFEFAKGN